MTREEAISWLEPFIWHEGEDVPIYDTDIEAIHMAIKALKQELILDKIRVEIEQLRLHKAQFLTNDNKVCIDSQEVFNILDKYKVESEVEDENDD